MKVVAICFIFLVLAQTAFPCMQVTGTKYNGKRVTLSGLSAIHDLKRALRSDRRPDGVKMEAALRGATNFNDRSDYSVALMYLGRSGEAVERLQQLETERPGQYFIAANLGTAYELSGNNEEALRWINEGIHRDPDSHEGTEWLHVKILEAKLAQKQDPDYFKKHSVLELQPEKLGPKIVIGGVTFTAKEAMEAIQYQLAERLQFVKPPDPAVASLLFDYAAIEAASRALEPAKPILALAVQYGYPSDRVQPLLKLYDQRIALANARSYGFYAFLVVAAVLLLVLLYKCGIFVISSRDLKRPG